MFFQLNKYDPQWPINEVSSDLLVNWDVAFILLACWLLCSSCWNTLNKTKNPTKNPGIILKAKKRPIIRESITSNFVRHYKTNWSSSGSGGYEDVVTLQRKTSCCGRPFLFSVWGKEKLLMRSLENRLHNGASHVDCPEPREK